MNSDLVRPSCSFIVARDPSIISYNRGYDKAAVNQAKMKLEFPMSSTDSLNTNESDDGMKIYLRIKKIPEDFSSHYELYPTKIICKPPEDSQYAKTTNKGESISTQFLFSQIFGPETTQPDMFHQVMKPRVLEFINGQNTSIMMFGASNSGKTFTTVGDRSDPGLIPRSLEYLFNSLEKVSEVPQFKPLPHGGVLPLDEIKSKNESIFSKNLSRAMSVTDLTAHVETYKAMQQRLSLEPASATITPSSVHVEVWVSYVEIYNEQIYDLFQKSSERGQQRKRLQLGQSNGRNYVKDLSYVFVRSSLEAYKVLQYGLHNLRYASTSMNAHSSRSHSIFTVRMLQVSDEGTHVSSLNFCDLAGHERCKATKNEGERLKESGNINGSLMVLGRCIQAVRNVQRGASNTMVPYRDSKLTQLFQEALSGKEDIALVINLNPARSVFDESQHVLNFSAIAKKVKIEEKKNVKKNRFSLYLHETHNRESELEELVEKHQNIIQDLQTEMEGQRMEFEEIFTTERNRIFREYDQLLKLVQDNCDKRVRRVQAEARSVENALREELRAGAVINLDSSSDSDEDGGGGDGENRHLNQSISNTELRKELAFVKEERDKLRVENEELKETLEDARTMYLEAKRDYEKAECARILLEERCAELAEDNTRFMPSTELESNFTNTKNK